VAAVEQLHPASERPQRPGLRRHGQPRHHLRQRGRLRQYWTAGVEPRVAVEHGLFGVDNVTEAGVRFHHEDQNRVQANGDRPTRASRAPARNASIREDSDRNVTAYSGFVQNSFDFGRWTVTPGLRYEDVDYERIDNLLARAARTPSRSGSRARRHVRGRARHRGVRQACTAASRPRASRTSSRPAAAASTSTPSCRGTTSSACAASRATACRSRPRCSAWTSRTRSCRGECVTGQSRRGRSRAGRPAPGPAAASRRRS